MHALFFVLLQAGAPAVALENRYVRVVRDSTPCASPSPVCRDRIIVALGDVTVESGGSLLAMHRGGIAAFDAEKSYTVMPGGSYFEVLIKSVHPAVETAERRIPAEKNAVLYNGRTFLVFEERLDVGDERDTHSHNQRVVIQLNRTRLQQWPEGQPMIERDIEPDRPAFNPPVIHKVKNVGSLPLRGIVIELKP